METKNHKKLPAQIRQLRDKAAGVRQDIIDKYRALSNSAASKKTPAYLKEKDIVASHILRSELELEENHADYDYSYTSRAIKKLPLSGVSGSLSEVCVGVMSKTLSARGSLNVAAGFFSTSVACIDDYLDKEGSFHRLGEKALFNLSHAYRDLMDIALAEEIAKGNITRAELHQIKQRLFTVIKTLVSSETTSDADNYLYRKSCGDKVIGILFPVSGASDEIKKTAAEIGRLTGEAGQLIDDLTDYQDDLKNNKKNHITMSGSRIKQTIELTKNKLKEARSLTLQMNLPDSDEEQKESVLWILDALSDVTCIINSQHKLKKPLTPALLDLSRPLAALFARQPNGLSKVPLSQLQVWF